jgi:hypothetical protein
MLISSEVEDLGEIVEVAKRGLDRSGGRVLDPTDEIAVFSTEIACHHHSYPRKRASGRLDPSDFLAAQGVSTVPPHLIETKAIERSRFLRSLKSALGAGFGSEFPAPAPTKSPFP